jgi:hypothetical protein
MPRQATARYTWHGLTSHEANQIYQNSPENGHAHVNADDGNDQAAPSLSKLDNSPTQALRSSLGNRIHDAANTRSSISVTGTRLSNRFRLLIWTICAYVIITPLAGLLFYYVYEVLVTQEPHVGRLQHSPSRTLLLVTIFTQTFLVVLHFLLNNVFDALRWQLASMKGGLDFTTFLALGGATSPYGAFMLLTVKGRHHVWSLQRYSKHYPAHQRSKKF